MQFPKLSHLVTNPRRMTIGRILIAAGHIATEVGVSMATGLLDELEARACDAEARAEQAEAGQPDLTRPEPEPAVPDARGDASWIPVIGRARA